MKKIRRIYVTHFGSPTAFYEKAMFDLTDPDTQQAVDTVFNLENGGGKTTLMSFIFSCFEPDERRWIQHLRNADRRFHEYFVNDGRPAVIMIEWDMPERSPGAGGYRLVIGQVVGMIDTKDRGMRAERHFFAFDTLDGFSLEDVPIVEGKNLAPVRNTSELVDWLYAQARTTGLSITKVQGDWVEELSNRRDIDVELLQRQVDFNSAEGGMDEGFLKFRSEEEFLRLFLGLTLAPTRCTSVRKAVAESVEQQKNRPRLKLRLTAMEKLKGAIAPLLERFGELMGADERCSAAKGQSASLRDELERLRAARAESSAQLGLSKQQHGETYDGAIRSERSALRDHTAMVGLQHERAAKTSATLQRQAEDDEKAAKDRMDHLQASRIYWQANASNVRAAELDAQIQLAKEGMASFRDDANLNGALLHQFLMNQVAITKQKSATDVASARAFEQSAGELKQVHQEASKALRAAQTAEATATAALDAGERERKALVEAGLLQQDDVVVQTAIDRYTAVAEEARAAQQNLQRELGEWSAKADHHDSEARKAKDEQGRKEREVVEPRRFYATGTELSGWVQDNALIRRIVESDVVDPDAMGLPKALADHLATIIQALQHNAVEADRIDDDKRSIEETGLAGRSHEVQEIVRHLMKAGVQSARPANTYLADVHRDAANARALLLSDPSLHLGVTVASAEWGKAVDALSHIEGLPSRPVVVGINTTAESVARAQQYTVGPANDALINRQAAMHLLDEVNQRLLANSTRQRELTVSADDCRDAIAKVGRYQREFGQERIEATRLEISRLEYEGKAAQARAEQALNMVRTLREQIKLEQPKIVEYSKRASAADERAARLRRYQSTYEGEREQKLLERERAQHEVERLTYRLEAVGAQIQEAQSAGLEAKANARRYDEQGATLSAEAERISYRETSADIAQLLRDRPPALEILRETYWSAVELLGVEEKKRVGEAVTQRDHARAAYTNARARLKKEYAAVSDEVCEGYKGLDFEAEIPNQKLAANLAYVGHIAAVKAATAAKANLDSFWRGQKEKVQPLPHMIDAPDEELARMIEEERNKAEHWNRIGLQAQRLELQTAQEEERHSKAAARYAAALRTLTTAIPLDGVAAQSSMRLADEDGEEAVVLEAAKEYRSAEQARASVERKAQEAFTQYQKASKEAVVIEAEPEIAHGVSSSTFDQARADAPRVSALIDERLCVVRSSLEKLDTDLQGVAGELYDLSFEGMRLFQHALSKNVPAGAPWVGGKAIMTSGVNIMGMAVADRKAIATNYLQELIGMKLAGKGDLPVNGAHMAAKCVIAMSGKSTLGLKLLTMEQNTDHQYRPVGSLKVSDGQGTVIAMFIYLLISQLRADTQAKGAERPGGGPLFLDNPYAKVQTKALIDVQRQVAAAADVQLIFFTANGDPNILAGFPRMIRLKKQGVSAKSGRSVVDFVQCSPADVGEVATT